MIWLLSIGAIIVSLSATIILYRRLSDWPGLDRLIAAIMPLLTVVLAGSALERMLFGQLFNGGDWNGARLAQSVALMHGYKLYYGPESGPVLRTMYGPTSVLAYLPAAFARSPTAAIFIGEVISILTFFLPILWLCLRGNTFNRRDVFYSCFAFLGFALYTCNLSLSESAFMIHADAPALGFAALACVPLYRCQSRTTAVNLFLSALFGTLAVWGKQTLAPLPLALLLYLLIAEGWRCFARYLAWLSVTGLAVSLLFLFLFEPGPTLFNMLTPARHPWFVALHNSNAGFTVGWFDRIKVLTAAGTELLSDVLLPVVVVSFAVVSHIFSANSRPPQVRTFFKERGWSMLLMVSLFLTPAGLAGRVKFGGADNNYSVTTYFLLAALFMVLMESNSNSAAQNSPVLHRAPKLFALTLVIVLAVMQLPSVYHVASALRALPDAANQKAYEFALKHPGELYFPWHPLASLMTEGKLYHFDYGLIDLKVSGYPMSDDHFRANIGSSIKGVAFYQPQSKDTLKFLPEFTREAAIDELPGWVVYLRP